VARTRRGVLLDRDGTLIDFHRDVELGAVVSAFHPDQIRLLPGVVSGLQALADAGFTLAIATNQPGAAKGQIPWSAIERTNRALCERLHEAGVTIAAVAVCGHHPEGGEGGDPTWIRACDCRKPAPGLLQQLAAELDLDPATSFMIGDTEVDVEAARRAGMRPAWLRDDRRCELCPGRALPPFATSKAPAVLMAARFDLLAQAILAGPVPSSP
jgi:D-glycero-D-manno-heptose 1,7-bisphosphate phosphatase